MPRLLSKIRLTTTIAAIGVATTAAAPAVAADGPKVTMHFGVARVAGWAHEAQARQRAAAAAEGPFAPLIGELDLGSGEAAFGAARSGHLHAGQDLFAPAGTPLVAVADGVVADAGSDGGHRATTSIFTTRSAASPMSTCTWCSPQRWTQGTGSRPGSASAGSAAPAPAGATTSISRSAPAEG